ncbi:serine/threonine-protein kinase [Coralloluteibacterium stylophorae]|uniref:Serine/threonine protein kinase n=1 Tax=Coralloluteibacterium stylophorae TaxID=1776034 RepID=A0A8J7VUV5_9GAMM|nr:serine/threonine-protein kinase [Coralloluteibacterium stylophorae]MBS7455634.1 serine/threonine protein kinase [Coralloluteibacterium stylophorae]
MSGRPGVRALFDAVCDTPPETWRRRLSELCSDADTIEDVISLLDAQTAALGRAATPIGTLIGALDHGELEVGARVGVWRLTTELGRGGMGSVFLAERDDRLYRHRVAIKLLRGLRGAAAAERLAVERQILADLQHPNIARLYDGGTTPAGNPYLVMEYVEGEHVDVWCARRAPSLGERLGLFLRIARAVQAAHQRLIVHCDIKPSNVLVRTDGEPVLLDFGIARLTGARDGQAAYGTPGYASPEQLAGERPGVTSDVHGLGVLLIELLSGTRARVRGDAATPPSPSALATDPAWSRALRGDLDAICARATAASADDRYGSVEEFAADIARVLARRPVAARNGGAAYRMRRFLDRNRFAVAAAVTVGVAVVGGLVVSLLALAEAREQKALVEARRQELERVTAFQASMLEDLDIEAMGAELVEGVRDGLRTLHEADPTADPVDRLQGSDIARELMRRQLLARAHAAIRSDFADVPEVGADLTESLARIEHTFGLYEDAARDFAALAEQRRAAGADAAAVLRAETGRAEAMWGVGSRNREARESLLAALAATELAPADPVRIHAETLAAELQLDSGSMPEALAALEELAARARHAALDEASLLEVEAARARALSKTGDVAAAAPLLEAVATRRVAILGAGHAATLASRVELAFLRLRMSDFEGGRALLGEILDVERRRLGLDHPRTLQIRTALAAALVELDRDDEALAELEALIAASTRVLGAEAPLTLRNRLNMASLLARTGQVERALVLEREVLDARTRLLGPEDPATLSIAINHGATLRRGADIAASRRLLEDVLPVAQRVLGERHPLTRQALTVLGQDAMDVGDVDAAVAYLRRSFDSLLAAGSDEVWLARGAWALVRALRRQGENGEADALYAKHVAALLARRDDDLQQAGRALRDEILAQQAVDAPASTAGQG